MKNIITLATVIITVNINAQNLKEADVPAAVKESFKNHYPSVKKADWEKENGNYEAEFSRKHVYSENGKTKKENIETSVLYDATGKLIQTEVEISISQLPKAVSEYVAKNLNGKKISEAAKITDAAGLVSFEAEIGEADYIFDANGNFIKKEVETDDDKK